LGTIRYPVIIHIYDSKINITTLNEIGNTTSIGKIIKTNNQQTTPKDILKKKGEEKIILFLIL